MKKLEVSDEEYRLILEGLLELPAKKSINLILNLENQNQKIEAPAFKMAQASKENK